MKNFFKNLFTKKQNTKNTLLDYKPLVEYKPLQNNDTKAELEKTNSLILEVNKGHQKTKDTLVEFVSPYIEKSEATNIEVLKMGAEIKNISESIKGIQDIVRGLLSREQENKINIMSSVELKITEGIKKATDSVRTTENFAKEVDSMRTLMKSQADDAKNAKELVNRLVEQFNNQKQTVAQQVASFTDKMNESVRLVKIDFQNLLDDTVNKLKEKPVVIEKIIEVPIPEQKIITADDFKGLEGSSITKTFREDVDKRVIEPAQALEEIKELDTEIKGLEGSSIKKTFRA